MNKFVGRNRNNNISNSELFTKYVTLLFTSVYIMENIPFVNTTRVANIYCSVRFVLFSNINTFVEIILNASRNYIISNIIPVDIYIYIYIVPFPSKWCVPTDGFNL